MAEEEQTLKDRFSDSLRRNFPESIGENKQILIPVIILFLVVMSVSLASNQMGRNAINEKIEDYTKHYREEVKKERESGRSRLGWFWFYLKNNLTVVTITVCLGIGFGIYPIYTILSNGFSIGYMVSTDISNYGAMKILSVYLPHGVLEITGFLIAATAGLRLGIGGIESLMDRDLGPLKESGETAKSLVPVTFMLIIMAAFTEAFISPFMGPGLNWIKILTSLIVLLLIILWTSGRLTAGGGR